MRLPFTSLFAVSILSLGIGRAAQTCLADFRGWQGLRVIEQEGRPSIMRAADLNGDGREELVVVNSRSSRLDIYAWRERPAQRAGEPWEVRVDKQRPNELPLAPDLEHQELQLETVPRDVLVQDVDGDAQPELVVLASSPNQVAVYRRQPASDARPTDWEKQYKVDLLAGDIAGRRGSLLIRPTSRSTRRSMGAASDFQLLVSMDNGIQLLPLQPGARAQWLTPREQRGRLDWWLADLDGDGHDDLVEQTRTSNESVRWYRATESGTLTPPAVLRDRPVRDVAVMPTSSAAQLVILEGSVRSLLRRYELELGTASALGRQSPLALDEARKAVWCGMWLDDKRALVVADHTAPRLLSYGLGDAGWETEQAYPALTDVRSLATMTAEPGTLLLWTKDAADLQKSRWESGRLSYPEPWPRSAEVEERRILALDSAGPITWWVQKVGEHLDLYLAKPPATDPAQIRFANVGAKADQVLWIGGERLLVKETHGRELKLFAREGDQAVVTSPTHLKKATLAEFKLFAVGEGVRLGRLTDGVLQWLGDDLRSHEQVMLPQGQPLADYVLIDEVNGWALQRDSPFVHRIRIGATRLSESAERIELTAAIGLERDPVLGMLLLGPDQLIQLSEGSSWEMKLVDVIDERVGRAGGVRKTRFHRLGTTDLDRDGYDDLVLYDELQHRLTVLGLAAPDGTAWGTALAGTGPAGTGPAGTGVASLQPKIAWPVFDDKVYPYADESDNLVGEPRSVLAADFDGDRHQDLAILCHDRLIIYLARDSMVRQQK